MRAAAAARQLRTEGALPPTIDFLKGIIERKLNTLELNTPAQKREYIEFAMGEETKYLAKLNTINGLNVFIARLYNDKMLDESVATTVVPDSDARLNGFKLDGWSVMLSSGNNADCLMHSFLTATCENFRKLGVEEKKEFANFFRRILFPTLQTMLCYIRENPEHGERIVDSIKVASGALEETIFPILANEYNINILVLRKDRVIGNIILNYNTDVVNHLLPPSCIKGERYKENITIFTQGGHYESVRNADRRYTINLQEVNRIADIFEQENRTLSLNTNTWSCSRCTYDNPSNTNECLMCGTSKVVNNTSRLGAFNKNSTRSRTAVRPPTNTVNRGNSTRSRTAVRPLRTAVSRNNRPPSTLQSPYKRYSIKAKPTPNSVRQPRRWIPRWLSRLFS